MIRRCENPRHPYFADYGGRGIQVCSRWRESAAAFAADMGPRPDGTSLDRIDNDKGYSPDNCRWATRSEQRASQRPPTYKGRKNAKLYELGGESMTLYQWGKKLGVSRHLLDTRIAKGWPIELVLQPHRMTSNQWNPVLRPQKPS